MNLDSADFPTRWILLPGLDGTGKLFEELLPHLPRGVSPLIVAYPLNRQSTALELVQHIVSIIPTSEPYLIVAESFSGPLALRAIATLQSPPSAIVLCASFGKTPISPAVSTALSWLAPVAARSPIPSRLIRFCLLDGAPSDLIVQFKDALAAVSTRALASRFRVLSEFNEEFVPATLGAPILYVQAKRDRILNRREAEWLQRRYPGVVVREVDSPHLALQCTPQDVVRLILDFVTK